MSGLRDRIRSAGSHLSAINPDMLPGWLATAGIAGWLFAGVALAIAIVAWFLAASSSISIPLLVALVVGMIAYPLCERMTERGVPRAAAAGIVLALLIAVIAGVIWIAVAGIVEQLPSIQEQIQKGIGNLMEGFQELGLDPGVLTTTSEQLREAAEAGTLADNPLVSGLLSSFGALVSAGLSGAFSAIFGLFIGTVLLYYVLSDFPTVAGWLGRHMGGLPADVGEGIVDDAVSAMRGYFRGTTISGFIIAAVIGAAMLLLGVPLALPVALVTFLTVYIPFLGAIISGAFAFVVALGSSGFTTAMVLLVVILVAQNVLQTMINARVMGTSLNLHPLVVLVATMLGGIFGGLLGAALGAPLAALFASAGKRLSVAFGEAEGEESGARPGGASAPSEIG